MGNSPLSLYIHTYMVLGFYKILLKLIAYTKIFNIVVLKAVVDLVFCLIKSDDHTWNLVFVVN